MANIKIVHLADIHIPNDQSEHFMFEENFQKLYKELEKIKPDKIVIIGDTLDAFITTSLEAESLAEELLYNLSIIAKVYVFIGNHEIRKRDLKRKSSIGTVIKMMRNPNVVLFEKSGFFEDEDIVWVNYSHLEKKIIPWQDIPHKKDKNKTYIGLFHDPVYGCKLPNNQTMNSKNLVKLSDFKDNDINMFGDIHLRQFLNDTTAYCGSFMQLTFGETIDKHGFLLWEIKDKNISVKEYDIDNEYLKITFNIKKDFDYDNIDFDHPKATEKCDFRVIWNDYSVVMNNENEQKIKDYFKEKWNSNVKFEKIRIYANINDAKSLNESINIKNPNIQREIFEEYLKLNKFNDDTINEILKIDETITSRLEILDTITNIEWTIDKIWVDNFKSYDKFDIDWSNIKNSIIQIGGENQQGKTTILDAITYITHGTTLLTNKLGGAKTEKHGDNRYINNKRKLNYCEGGMIIDVNGEKYILHRRTDRTLKKDGTIKSVSSQIEYYEGTEMIEENKLRGEQKTDTQKMLDAIIGDFEDFVRLTLTNSENLNHLLSIDRATFIDSVVRDAGYDIFEKKLNEFKNYRKEFEDQKIIINVDEEKEKLKEILNINIIKEKELEELNIKLNDINDDIKTKNSEKELLIKKLHKINDEIKNIDVDDINNKIEQYKKSITDNQNKINLNKKNIVGLKESYDEETYNLKLKEIKKIEDDILNIKLDISREHNNIEKEKNNLSKIKDKLRELRDKEIDKQSYNIKDIESTIKSLNDEYLNKVKDFRYEHDSKIKDIKHEIDLLNSELTSIKKEGKSIKDEITETEENKICLACDRPFDNIDEIVNKLNNKLSKLLKNGKDIQEQIKNKEKEINLLENQNIEENDELIDFKNNIDEKIQLEENKIEEINNLCEEIKKGNYSGDLLTYFEKAKILKTKTDSNINDINKNIQDKNEEIKLLNKKIDQLSIEIKILDKEKDEVNRYNILSQEIKELTLKLENIKLNIENAQNKISLYHDQLIFIKENNTNNQKIKDIENDLEELIKNKDEIIEKINDIKTDITINKDNITKINSSIQKYEKWTKMTELFKHYEKCVHRDGIPTYLLQKSRLLINQELSDFLSNVDFVVYFDNDLNLKLIFKDFPDVEQNLLTSSGMERTFGAIALKMALRVINNNSRPNILLLDEVMPKLKSKSVTLFNDLLIKLKQNIDKILIIEHTYDVPFDHMINVVKNKKGISSLTID